ncbi:hypothetical protein AAHH67_07435 [Niallia circulans]
MFEEEDEPTLWGKQTFPKWKVPPTIELHQVDFAYTNTNFRLESITATFYLTSKLPL